MAITASDVKKLRDQTGAGMMDCKTALEEANGNFEEANTILRKKGLASAAKKAGRSANQGLIGHLLSDDHTKGILAEVNCESDFVARTEDFQQLVADVLAEIDRKGEAADEAWLKDPAGPIQQRLAASIGKLGENMAVSRFVRYAGQGYIAQYIHMSGMNNVGVQVEFAGVTPSIAASPDFAELVKKVVQQITAASPEVARYASRGSVPAEVLDKERAIYRAQMENTGKPANIIDKIVEGKLGSFYSLVVLPDQASVHDPKMTVADVIAAAAKTLGAPITVTRFARLKVGEASLPDL
jgi:elongation factor Ts